MCIVYGVSEHTISASEEWEFKVSNKHVFNMEASAVENNCVFPLVSVVLQNRVGLSVALVLTDS